MMTEYKINWSQIKSLPLRKEELDLHPLDLPDESVPSSQAYLDAKSGFKGTKDELRRVIFGNRCHFCGTPHDEKQLLLHRKDGRPHHQELTIKEKYYRTLDPKDWVFLCNPEHRGVHWALDTLGLSWDDLMRKRMNGAEGEI